MSLDVYLDLDVCDHCGRPAETPYHGNVTGNLTGNVTGSVGSVTGAVGSDRKSVV